MVRILEAMHSENFEEEDIIEPQEENQHADNNCLDRSDEEEEPIQNEEQWTQSFLSTSIVDEESCPKESEIEISSCKDPEANESISSVDSPGCAKSKKLIPQIDGYWDDSDSSGSNPESKKERRRKRAAKVVYTPGKNKPTDRDNVTPKSKIEPQKSVKSRLSLTRRRRSEKPSSNHCHASDEESIISSASTSSSRSTRSRTSLPNLSSRSSVIMRKLPQGKMESSKGKIGKTKSSGVKSAVSNSSPAPISKIVGLKSPPGKRNVALRSPQKTSEPATKNSVEPEKKMKTLGLRRTRRQINKSDISEASVSIEANEAPVNAKSFNNLKYKVPRVPDTSERLSKVEIQNDSSKLDKESELEDIADAVKTRARACRFRDSDSESSKSVSPTKPSRTRKIAQGNKLHTISEPVAESGTLKTPTTAKPSTSSNGSRNDVSDKKSSHSVTEKSKTLNKPRGRGRPRKRKASPDLSESKIVSVLTDSKSEPPSSVVLIDCDRLKVPEDQEKKLCTLTYGKSNKVTVTVKSPRPVCSDVLLKLIKCDSPHSDLKSLVDQVEQRMSDISMELSDTDEEPKENVFCEPLSTVETDPDKEEPIPDPVVKESKSVVSPVAANKVLEEDEQLDDQEQLKQHEQPNEDEKLQELEQLNEDEPVILEEFKIAPPDGEHIVNNMLESLLSAEADSEELFEQPMGGEENWVPPFFVAEQEEAEISTTTSSIFELEALVNKVPPRWTNNDCEIMDLRDSDTNSPTDVEVSSSSNGQEIVPSPANVLELENLAYQSNNVEESGKHVVVNAGIQTTELPKMCDIGVGTSLTFFVEKVDKATQTEDLHEPKKVSIAVGSCQTDLPNQNDTQEKTTCTEDQPEVEILETRSAEINHNLDVEILSASISPKSKVVSKSPEASKTVKIHSPSGLRDANVLPAGETCVKTPPSGGSHHHQYYHGKFSRKHIRPVKLTGSPDPVKLCKEKHLMELARVNKSHNLSRKAAKALQAAKHHADRKRHSHISTSSRPKGHHDSKLSRKQSNSSIDSVFEYSILTPEIKLPSESPSPVSTENPESFQNETPTRQSIFQMKKAKKRSKSQLHVSLLANKGVPDIDKYEFEPLKPPPSYRDIKNWAESRKNAVENNMFVMSNNTNPTMHQSAGKETMSLKLDMDLSDEEELPEVRPFGGQNLSDEDESGGNNDSVDLSQCSAKESYPVTPTQKNSPAVVGMFSSSAGRRNSGANSSESMKTPRSILKLFGNSKRRNSASLAKRRIRWVDEAGGNVSLSVSSGDSNGINVDSFEDLKQKISNVSNCDPLERAFQERINTSEIDGVSPKNSGDFVHDMSNLQDAKALHMVLDCNCLHFSSTKYTEGFFIDGFVVVRINI